MNGSHRKYRQCIQPVTNLCEFVNFPFRLVPKWHYDFSIQIGLAMKREIFLTLEIRFHRTHIRLKRAVTNRK